jgi:hypothetical protein
MDLRVPLGRRARRDIHLLQQQTDVMSARDLLDHPHNIARCRGLAVAPHELHGVHDARRRRAGVHYKCWELLL